MENLLDMEILDLANTLSNEHRVTIEQAITLLVLFKGKEEKISFLLDVVDNGREFKLVVKDFL